MPETTDAAERIYRRLRLQHARWLLSDPGFHTRWRGWRRNCCRSFRRGFGVLERLFCATFESPVVIFVTLAIGVVLVAGLLGSMLLMPGKLLQLPLAEHDQFDSPEQQTQTALFRLAVISSGIAVGLLLLMPGKEDSTSNVQRINQHAKKLGRSVRSRIMLRPRNLTRQLVVLGGVLMISLSVILWDSGGTFWSRFLAIDCAGLTVITIGFALWHFCVRMLPIRSRSFGSGQITRADAVGFFLLPISGIGVMVWLLSHNSIAAADKLIYFGPIGLMFALLQGVAAGHWINAFYLLLIGLVVLWAAPQLTRHLSSWPSRRAIVEAHRVCYAVAEPAQEAISEIQSIQERQQISLLLNQSIAGRRWTNWRCWLWPTWLQRRFKWYLWMMVGALIVQLPILCFEWTYGGASQVTTVGEVTGTAPKDNPIMMAFTPILFAAALLEGLALTNRILSSRFQQRPIHALVAWREIQLEGVQRLPLQLLLLSPVLLGAALGSAVNAALVGKMVLVLVGMSFVVRTILVSMNAFIAIAGIVPRIAIAFQLICFGILFACFFLLVQCIALVAGFPLPFGAMGLQVTVCVLVAYSLFVAGIRRYAQAYPFVEQQRRRVRKLNVLNGYCLAYAFVVDPPFGG